MLIYHLTSLIKMLTEKVQLQSKLLKGYSESYLLILTGVHMKVTQPHVYSIAASRIVIGLEFPHECEYLHIEFRLA